MSLQAQRPTLRAVTFRFHPSNAFEESDGVRSMIGQRTASDPSAPTGVVVK